MVLPSLAPHRVVVLAAGAVDFDATVPPQVLGEAFDAKGHPLYDVQVVTVDNRPVHARQGYRIAPSSRVDALVEAQTVVVPSTDISDLMQHGSLPSNLRRALAMVPRDARWVSLCTGAFVLAAAGVLNGHRATTHWKYAEDFRLLFPEIALDEELLLIDDGRVLTSAGLSAGVDLCLHLIRIDHGPGVANAVARHMLVSPWRGGGQTLFDERQVLHRTDAATSDVRAWAQAHLDSQLDVATLAAQASMSVRTFTRRFRVETGQSPNAWVTQQRVRQARHLLETTDLPIEQVATSAGLGTAASLRQHFRANVGVSPLTYRNTFRGPVDS